MNGLRKLFLILLLNYACFYDNPMLLVVMQGGIGYQVSDITSTKWSFGYFSLDTPTPFAVLTVFLDNT